MSRRSLPALLLAAAAACSANDQKAAASDFALISPAFASGATLPREFTCNGANTSPPLAWSHPPAASKSYVLIVDDPDAPGGTFRHWGLYDLPASARSIDAGQAPGRQAVNDLGKPGYGGPCPPSGTHHYRFKLYALDVEKLGLPPSAKVAEVESAAENHSLGRADLVGTYR